MWHRGGWENIPEWSGWRPQLLVGGAGGAGGPAGNGTHQWELRRGSPRSSLGPRTAVRLTFLLPRNLWVWGPCPRRNLQAELVSQRKKKELSLYSGVDSKTGPGAADDPRCQPGWGSRARSVTIRGSVGENNNFYWESWGLGALSDHQNSNMRYPALPGRCRVAPHAQALLGPLHPVLHARGQLLPGTPPPHCPLRTACQAAGGLFFLRQSRLQAGSRPAPRATGQLKPRLASPVPDPHLSPEPRRPSPALD